MAIGDMPNACLSFMNQTGPGRFRGFGAFRRLNARQVRLGRGELGDFHGVRFSKLGHRKTHDGHPRACAPIHRSRGTAIGLNTDVAGPTYGDRAAVLVREKSFQSIPANRTVRDTLGSGGRAEWPRYGRTRGATGRPRRPRWHTRAGNKAMLGVERSWIMARPYCAAAAQRADPLGRSQTGACLRRAGFPGCNKLSRAPRSRVDLSPTSTAPPDDSHSRLACRPVLRRLSR